MARSKFEVDYKNAINNILRDIYGTTEYWGVGSAGNEGIIKPLTNEDDPNWSNYNFINTHYIVRDKVVIPYLNNIGDFTIDFNKTYTEDTGNRNFFRLLWQERQNIFGTNSSLKSNIVNTVNKTRSSGVKRENFVKIVLESLPGTKVTMTSEAGGSLDFAGIDMTIESIYKGFSKKSSTAQIKTFEKLSKGKKYWYVSTDSLRRDYNTDLMIFGKQSGQEYHIAVFDNQPKRFIFESDRVIIPVDLCKILINYNTITGKSVVKNY
jgi:hypothetical protein